MKYLVFLDIDGVFTSNRVEFTEEVKGLLWSKFDPIAMEFMNRIHDTFDDVHFVLSSTWRDRIDVNDSHAHLWIITAMRNAGFKGNLAYPYWKVNPFDEPLKSTGYDRRAWEIKDYLQDHAKGYKDFIIFDDTDFGFKEVLGVKRLVKTDSNDGLLFKHMLNAWSMMGNWDKK